MPSTVRPLPSAPGWCWGSCGQEPQGGRETTQAGKVDHRQFYPRWCWGAHSCANSLGNWHRMGHCFMTATAWRRMDCIWYRK